MYARCDMCDILLYLSTECTGIYPCEKCWQYINCENCIKMYVFGQYEFEDYMIYTDGETP
jgi:hypothetical protein